MVLKRERGRADAFLHVSGRDIENDIELALRWNADAAGWIIAGDADEYRLSAERAAIMRVLEEVGEPMTPTEAADALGKGVNGVKTTMWRMAHDGQLVSKGGRYSIRFCNPSNPVTGKGEEHASGYSVTGVTHHPGDPEGVLGERPEEMLS